MSKAQEIADRIEQFTEQQPCHFVMRGYTFDHIVLGDYNLDKDSIYWCMSNKVIIQIVEDLIHKVRLWHDPHYDKGQNFVPIYPRQSPDQWHDMCEIILELARIIQFMNELAEESEEDLDAAMDILIGTFD